MAINKKCLSFGRPDATPESKRNKMVRYHEPPPFWGPKSKPKRKADKDTNDEQVIKIFN